MSETDMNVIFNLEGTKVEVQCTKNDKMRDACNKFVQKSGTNINSLLFYIIDKL